ncbi:hypothetical protein NEPAR03_1510, partial [Nematocida parisii]
YIIQILKVSVQKVLYTYNKKSITNNITHRCISNNHNTLYNTHSSISNNHNTLYNTHSTLNNTNSILNNIHSTLNNTNNTMCNKSSQIKPIRYDQIDIILLNHILFNNYTYNTEYNSNNIIYDIRLIDTLDKI